MNRSAMYGNRGVGRFSSQQGILGNANVMMTNQMAGMRNMQLLNQGGGQRDLRGGAGLMQMNPSLGMREMQQPAGYNIDSRMNFSPQMQKPVLEMLPRRSSASGMRRGGSFDRRGRSGASFSPPLKRSRPVAMSAADDDDDDIAHGDDRRTSRAKFKCQVCRLQFASIDEFDCHMGSEGHAANMKMMSVVYQDKNHQLLTSNVTSQRRRTSTPSGRSGVCQVCDRTYSGQTEQAHIHSKQHQHRLFLLKKGCLLCGVNGFDNYRVYVSHIDSAEHKQKKQQLSNSRGSMSSIDAKSSKSQTDNVESSPNKPATTKDLQVEQKSPVAEKQSSVDDLPTQSETETVSPHFDVTESNVLDDDDLLDEPVYNPDIAIGVEHVISVTGYFCKLCHKFYNNETMARITHCKSQSHFNKYLEHQHQKSLLHEATTARRGAK